MKYVGGKSKLATPIVDTMLYYVWDRHTYIEPFVGGAAVATRAIGEFGEASIGDMHPDVIALYRALADGWTPPDDLSEDEYNELRDHARAHPEDADALRGFAGFGCSFGAKWFGGYARGYTGELSDGTPRSYAGESKRSLLKTQRAFQQHEALTIARQPYTAWSPTEGTVVYCDPPYRDTQGYAGTAPFDTDAFWLHVETWRDIGAHVFVSEYQAPAGWEAVWELDHLQTLSLGNNDTATVERLYYRPPV